MLAKYGGKMAPFVKQLILRELALDEAMQSGRTQADPRFFMRVVSPGNPVGAENPSRQVESATSRGIDQ